MNEQEKKGIIKMAVGLLGTAVFAILGILARRKKIKWAVYACIVGALVSLLYAYTGYRDYRIGHYGGLKYGQVPPVYECKAYAIGPVYKLDKPRCKLKD
jgi:O-antigen/teichoic acid export membrane protein